MAKVNAVQTTYQFIILPYLYRFGKTQFVKPAISFSHIRSYPSAGLSVALNVAAIRYHFLKSSIKCYPEHLAVNDVAHAFGYLKLIGKQYHAFRRAPP